jgi:uncharacterized protein
MLVIALTVLGSAHYYLWARLVRDAGWPHAVQTGATLFIAFLGVGMITSLILRRRSQRRFGGLLATMLYGWMGVGLLLITALGSVDLLRLLFGVARALGVSGGPFAQPLDHRTPALVAGALGLMLSLIAVREGTRPPRLVRVAVPVPKLPSAVAGLRILQISDLHIGATLDRRFLERVVARINEQNPDVVAITGDLVDGSVASLADHVSPLRSLRARYGVYFVPGNHDHYAGLEPWLVHLTGLGIRVLRNDSVVVGEGDGAFVIAGVDDPTGRRTGNGGPDLSAALAGRPAGLPVILLAHQPGEFDEAAGAGVALQLSGHTHGGQIFPFSFIVSLFQRYMAGLYRRGDSHLYVSRGTGFWGPPLRLGAPSEITELQLATA